MIVIPAIDILDGKVVRLRKGEYDDVTIYPMSPLEQAMVYRDAGFRRMHIVDLNGAREGKFVNLPIVSKIVKETGMQVQTGGGIRNIADIEHLLDAGLQAVVVSSMAVKSPDEWIKAISLWGGERCILGLDLKDGKMAYAGWTQTSDVPIKGFLEPMLAAGLRQVLCTDIGRDGMLVGANVAMYRDHQKLFPKLDFIASGGVSGKENLMELSQAGLYACVVGRAYYEGRVSLGELVEVNQDPGIS